MTDPVSRVYGISETGRRSGHEKQPGDTHRKQHTEAAEDDCVDISEEARDRSSGKRKKNILEYLKEDDT